MPDDIGKHGDALCSFAGRKGLLRPGVDLERCLVGGAQKHIIEAAIGFFWAQVGTAKLCTHLSCCRASGALHGTNLTLLGREDPKQGKLPFERTRGPEHRDSDECVGRSADSLGGGSPMDTITS
ncbi:hypothetical protein NDU88_001864 [Pleurodeles waltl]|uniref:Uncharacterized protein n=1 Tax=Pleurodeles waltl TaxID=8319 RepID=A0AAV7Q895_PLEWA|nr:hypothetical protein NDU88_001864 [Pleurodeles waltl]